MLPNSRLVAQLSRATKQLMYSDSGYIIKSVGTGTYDTYNHEVMTTSNIPVECSFTDKPSREIWKDHVDLENIEAEVRLNTKPTKGDSFKITKRFGNESYSDKTFEIVGIMPRGDFGYVVALKAVSV